MRTPDTGHRSRFSAVNLVYLSLMMALFSCVPACGNDPPPLETAIFRALTVPNVDLGREDNIRAVDVAISDPGTLHVVWNVVLHGPEGTLPSYRTYYSRGDEWGTWWTAPVEVDSTIGSPRLLVDRDRIHVITGSRLRHLVKSYGDGKMWKDEGELLPAGYRRAAGFDAAIVDGTLMVVCFVRPDPPYDRAERTPKHRQQLLIIRPPLLAKSKATSRVLAEFGASLSDPAYPRLLAVGRRLDLVVAVNLDEWWSEAQDGAAAVFERERVFYMGSSDGGVTWSQALELETGATADASPVSGRRPIEEVDLIRTPTGLHIFLTGLGIFVIRSSDGRRWSAPLAINLYPTSLSMGEARSTSVSVAGSGGNERVAWIDHRFRRSDRRAWNPLAGFPWSDDDPFWANNDVFTLKLSEVDAFIDTKSMVIPVRLTPPLSYARVVRVRSAAGRSVILWSGRREVGKDECSADAPPEIFFISIP